MPVLVVYIGVCLHWLSSNAMHGKVKTFLLMIYFVFVFYVTV